jgi:serine protease
VPPPDDPGFPKQWNLPMIQIPDAWAVSRGAGATVAVLDTGVAYEDSPPYQRAPDLAGTKLVPGHDFVDGDDHPDDDIDPAAPDRPAHGTHSAGIIAQTTGNGVGEAGVAPEAAIMPVRVLGRDGSGTDDQIAAGIVFAADHGAQVINMSFDSPDDRPMTRAAVAYAASKGVTMVAATGNTGRAVVGWPAAYPDVIAVGAVRIDRTRPAYSSYGVLGDVDLVAPGGDLSVDQNGDGAPDGILNQTMVYSTDTFGEQAVEGTSAAAPHVSGVAALLIGSGLATTPAQVRRALVGSALDLGPPGPDPMYGAGLVQARAALTAAGAPPPEPVPASVTPTSSPAAVRPPAPPAPAPGRATGSRTAALAGAAALVLAAAGAAAAIRRRRRRPPSSGS